MHPEVEKNKPGRCPKCGMRLLIKGEKVQAIHHELPEKVTWKSYMPLIVVIGIILLTTLTLSYRDILNEAFSFTNALSYFMIGFFLVFAGFKLMDLKGFAEGYSTYDLLAQRWFPYGYIYPFIELFFGLGMILLAENRLLLWAEVIVMTFSGIGVAIKLLKKEKFQCACLGTFLKIPLTKVTIIEDFGMAILALVLLMLS
jgi:hypothetical protein